MSDRGSHRETLNSAGARYWVGAAALVGGTGLTSCSEQASSKSFHIEPASRSRYELVKAEGSHRELGGSMASRRPSRSACTSITSHARRNCHRTRCRTKALKLSSCSSNTVRICWMRSKPGRGGGDHACRGGWPATFEANWERRRTKVCTTYVIGKSSTGEKEILVGQNSDMSQPNIEMGYMLHLKPIDKPQVLIWTFGGMIGYHRHEQRRLRISRIHSAAVRRDSSDYHTIR